MLARHGICATVFDRHSEMLARYGVQVDECGRIAASVNSPYRYQTSHSKIFAGSDAVRGADLVVTAMAEVLHAVKGMMA